MKPKRFPLSEKIQKLPMIIIFVVSLLIWLPFALNVLNRFEQVDSFTFLIFSPLGFIMLVWSFVYFIALLCGYGITNTPSYPGARTLNNMELVKPKFTKPFEKVLLFIMSTLFAAISAFLLIFALFIS